MSDLLTETHRIETENQHQLRARTERRLREALTSSYGSAVAQLELLEARVIRRCDGFNVFEHADLSVRLRGHRGAVRMYMVTREGDQRERPMVTSIHAQRSWLKIGSFELRLRRRLTPLQAAELLSA